jgi:hypothetical protein
MKDKIKNAVEELKNLGVQNNAFVQFDHIGKDPSKSFIGKVFYNSAGVMEMSLISIKGYSKNYITQNARSLFVESVLPYPKRGDTVWTSNDGGLRTPGEIYTLGGNSYYYGVGSSVLNCNGRRFYEDVKATYVRKDIGTCSPGSTRSYNLFKLL